jgi:lipopolysaccharide export LptBFGC system permease protein LptF
MTNLLYLGVACVFGIIGGLFYFLSPFLVIGSATQTVIDAMLFVWGILCLFFTMAGVTDNHVCMGD